MLFERKKMLADDPNYSLYSMYEKDINIVFKFNPSFFSSINTVLCNAAI